MTALITFVFALLFSVVAFVACKLALTVYRIFFAPSEIVHRTPVRRSASMRRA